MSAVPGAIAGVGAAFRNLLGLNQDPPGFPSDDPSWKQRVKEAAYKSPSGTRLPFAFENVSRTIPLRSAEFQFPGVDNSYVQQNGISARRYPMLCFFWGPDHDRLADIFEGELMKPGVGQLEHPLYGTFDVVPFGEINRRDDLRDAANQSVVEVTFLTTTGAVYPSSPIAAKSEIQARIDEFKAQAAAQFEAGQGGLKKGITKDANLMAKVRGMLTKASKALSSVAAVNTAVTRDFRDAQSAINFGLDTLVGQPLQLAIQMQNMVTAPSRALAGIAQRLDAYHDLAQSVVDSSGATAELAAGSEVNRVLQKLTQDFQVEDLVATAAVVGSVSSAVNNTFATKSEALATAEAILAQLDEIVAWRDEAYENIGESVTFVVDTGEAYQALLAAVSVAAGYLIQISFTLIPERRLTLDRARTVIDVCAQVYGTVDGKLDFFIATNDFSGDELLELPAGTTVKYYTP
jgi:prophage DNA circulation protein